jgi:hypothetical protein
MGMFVSPTKRFEIFNYLSRLIKETKKCEVWSSNGIITHVGMGGPSWSYCGMWMSWICIQMEFYLHF